MAHRPLRLSLVLVVLALLPFGAATAWAQPASPVATSPDGPAAGITLCPPDASSDESSSDSESPPPAGSPAPLADNARFETERFVASYQLPEGWQVGLDIPSALQLIGPGERVFVNLSLLDAPIDPDDPLGREPVAIEAWLRAPSSTGSLDTRTWRHPSPRT